MLNQSRMKVLKELQNLRYPYYIEKLLKERLATIEYSEERKGSSGYNHLSSGRLQRYETNKIHLLNIRKKLEKEAKYTVAFSVDESEEKILERVNEIKKNMKTKNLKVKAEVSLPKTETEIKELAYDISIYFSQGFEMYKTSINTDISSSPIIEYYAMLQIIKAIILLELKVDTQEFFGAHGLERKKIKRDNSIFQVKTKTHGVFAALLLRTSSSLTEEDGTKTRALDKYYTNYYPKFEELVDKQILYLDIPKSFIFLWILSEIARYHPKKWKEICLGENNDWITSINEFREEGIPKLFFDLLNFHCN